MTETEQALLDAKHEIERAVTEAAAKLRDRTGLLATVHIETIDTSTYGSASRIYSARLQFSYDPR